MRTTFRQKGDFSKATKFLERAKEAVHLGDLDKYGRAGVAALAAATPVDTGKTAASWRYEIVQEKGVGDMSRTLPGEAHDGLYPLQLYSRIVEFG